LGTRIPSASPPTASRSNSDAGLSAGDSHPGRADVHDLLSSLLFELRPDAVLEVEKDLVGATGLTGWLVSVVMRRPSSLEAAR